MMDHHQSQRKANGGVNVDRVNQLILKKRVSSSLDKNEPRTSFIMLKNSLATFQTPLDFNCSLKG